MRHFDISEFDCPCCGQNAMEQAFLNMLDNARHIAMVPFVINSGYRCPGHNKDPRVGGSATSSHLLGLAADIKCTNSRDRFKIIRAFYKVGFKRFTPKPTFIHVDLDLLKDQEVMWL